MNSSVPKINLKSTLNWNSIGKAILDLILISFFTMLASIIALISMLVNNGAIASKTKKKERLYFNSKIIFEVNKKTTFLYGKYKFIFSDYIQIGP